MKPIRASRTIEAVAEDSAATPRYGVYQQTRAGTYTAGFSTNSDEEAVASFMRQEPAFEGGEVRLLDRVEQRMVGFVKWKIDRTELGLPVFHRENVFNDWHLALAACVVQRQQESRTAVELIA